MTIDELEQALEALCNAVKDGKFTVRLSDLVDVVRCKDCKHSYYDSELEKYWCTNYSGSIEKSAYGFCDDGKPRSE